MILKERNWKEIAVTIGVANFNPVWGDKAATLKK
jgi:hypothetical protein